MEKRRQESIRVGARSTETGPQPALVVEGALVKIVGDSVSIQELVAWLDARFAYSEQCMGWLVSRAEDRQQARMAWRRVIRGLPLGDALPEAAPASTSLTVFVHEDEIRCIGGPDDELVLALRLHEGAKAFKLLELLLIRCAEESVGECAVGFRDVLRAAWGLSLLSAHNKKLVRSAVKTLSKRLALSPESGFRVGCNTEGSDETVRFSVGEYMVATIERL